MSGWFARDRIRPVRARAELARLPELARSAGRARARVSGRGPGSGRARVSSICRAGLTQIELARSDRVSPHVPSWLGFPSWLDPGGPARRGSSWFGPGEPARDRASSIPRASPENRARSTGLGQLNSPATVKHLVVGCVVVPSPLSLVVVVHLERARVTSLVPGGTVERSA